MSHIILDANDFGLSFLGVGDAGLTGVLGYAVVFIGLSLLLAVLLISGSIFKAKAKKAAAVVMPSDPAPAPEAKQAPGSAGEVKLFDVPDKEAAMIMAIVADKLQKPLNELRFISIKEIK
ncbi:MAG: OadG family protein [Oscillospiraceae bacterium]|nr:OadG family protein [Oscillospiraceae bacterium]